MKHYNTYFFAFVFGVPAFLMYKYGATEGLWRTFAFGYYAALASFTFGAVCAIIMLLAFEFAIAIKILFFMALLTLVGLASGFIANGTSYIHFDLLYYDEITTFLGSLM